ncbi:probable 2-oxoglutarate-dependent dioxygenase AOP1.2 [Solanum tuberosum]|uniref:probable 2-oxoglutarate-dependent dioxygenase AOP1.2 n=1 Tax=Solanum tuberosum TaxID=4113 RepID=UPI0003D244DB|nr:PREDICTED: probable 2-oxoglutarate-dependent dioxygenase AOP1.2 [Solanum tuberosum]
MASTKVTIPTIDFCDSELKPNTPQWESTKVQVFEALQEFGCFEAIYNKVPNEIREGMFDTLKEVFDFPLPKLIEYREKPFHIYDGQIPSVPLFGSVYSADLVLPNSVETFANTFWSHGNPNFSNVAKSYFKQLMELNDMVEKMVLESLGLKNYTDEFLNSNVYMSRFTNYKVIKGENENKSALPSHTDSSYLTIIKQNQNGLQVL